MARSVANVEKAQGLHVTLMMQPIGTLDKGQCTSNVNPSVTASDGLIGRRSMSDLAEQESVRRRQELASSRCNLPGLSVRCVSLSKTAAGVRVFSPLGQSSVYSVQCIKNQMALDFYAIDCCVSFKLFCHFLLINLYLPAAS